MRKYYCDKQHSWLNWRLNLNEVDLSGEHCNGKHCGLSHQQSEFELRRNFFSPSDSVMKMYFRLFSIVSGCLFSAICYALISISAVTQADMPKSGDQDSRAQRWQVTGDHVVGRSREVT